ncbi:unnamed protein product [Moneuplotes crassus]|uniref:Uncharacterized protein n=2 Tax=Euplotes crassus TaxID=5936 RepID=A0AAD1YBC7_EUPCR|nr:unnamed protein product [Moneuplotes crassus]
MAMSKTRSGWNIPKINSMVSSPGSNLGTQAKMFRQKKILSGNSSREFKSQEPLKSTSPRQRRMIKKRPKIEIDHIDFSESKTRRTYRNHRGNLVKAHERELPEISEGANKQPGNLYSKMNSRASTRRHHAREDTSSRGSVGKTKAYPKNPDILFGVNPTPKKRGKPSGFKKNHKAGTSRKQPPGKISKTPFMKRTLNSNQNHISVDSFQDYHAKSTAILRNKLKQAFTLHEQEKLDDSLHFEFAEEIQTKTSRYQNMNSCNTFSPHEHLDGEDSDTVEKLLDIHKRVMMPSQFHGRRDSHLRHSVQMSKSRTHLGSPATKKVLIPKKKISNNKIILRGSNQLDLQNKFLSQKGADKIIDKLPGKIEILNLSYNPSMKDLNMDSLIFNYEKRIKELNLERNNVGDSLVIKLCQAIRYRPLMECLNLSHNQLTSRSAEAIAEMLKENSSMHSLFLKWNNIHSKGAAAICDALKANNSLKVLELSFNPIGGGFRADTEFEKLTELYGEESEINENNANTSLPQKSWNVSEHFRDMFKTNKTLIHLDLSYCCFSLLECQIMHEGLKENHTILGLHMVGNKMCVDSLGFLRRDEMSPSSCHFAPRMEPKLETGTISEKKLLLNSNYNCWICEGWTEATFKFDPYRSNNPPSSDLTEQDKVFIHFSFDDYRPDQMKFSPGEPFSIIRMVPPKPFNYYFSINGASKYATDLETESLFHNPNTTIPYANIPTSIRQTKAILSPGYVAKMNCVPRPKRQFLIEEDPPVPEWDIRNSVFWGYMIDTNDIHRKCFEFDWAQCKIPRIIKDPEEQLKVKNYLESIYKPIRETYKYYAGFNPCGHVPCIGQNVFNEIINLTDIVDGKDLKLSDIDLEFIATKAGNKKKLLNPERWLVRYQLMEVLVRIAIHKYCRSRGDDRAKSNFSQSMGSVKPTSPKVQKEIYTHSQAVKKLFEEHFLEHMVKFDCNKWRVEKLWNQQNDEVLKKYYKQIKSVFEIYSGKHTKPGKPKFSSIEEFLNMVMSTGVLKNGSIGVSEMGAIFNVSMMTQIDELNYQRHLEMYLLEFIEAICRFAARCTDIPRTGDDQARRVFTPEKSLKTSEDGGLDEEALPLDGNKLLTTQLSTKAAWEMECVEHLPLHDKIRKIIELLIDTNF